METFRSHPKALITNARCLTEGIDVPAVDMVAFLNKKRSKIDIIQAIGRSLRKVPGKVYGHVFLPLFVADNKGETLEQAVERADYREIWEVIQALSEQDEALEATIQQLKCNKAKTGMLEAGLEKYIDITSQTIDEALHKRLQKIISVKVVDRAGSFWKVMYDQLSNFRKENGHCNVPPGVSASLSTWISNQRTAYKDAKLNASKIEQLNALGFNWYVHDNQWKKYFDKLKNHRERHGDCSKISDSQLKSWVNNQKTAYKKNNLESWKIEKLNSLDFNWHLFRNQWQKRFQELQTYQQKYGISHIPRKHPLSFWMTTQRRALKKGILESWKIEKLNALGLDWDPFISAWQKNLKQLKDYNKRHGHCNIPYGIHNSLYAWILNQKKSYKKGKLDTWKIEKLNALGFDWNPVPNQWHEWFKKLQNHKKEFKHFEISNDSSLRSWLNKQRVAHRKNRLEPWKIECLNALGLDWSPKLNQWQKRLEELQAYKQKYGHCNVSSAIACALNVWISAQRTAYKKVQLDAWKVERLNALGFDWDPLLNQWQVNFEQLQAYKQKHGHCNASSGASCSLRKWVLMQRRIYKEGRLNNNKIVLLNSLGFDWDPYVNQWNQQFEKLQYYKKQHGHCNVFMGISSSLCSWVWDQRKSYKKGELDAWKIEKLNTLEFDWDPRLKQWQTNFEQLQAHKEKHGDCEVPDTTSSLYNWIKKQKMAYKKGLLENPRVALLNSLDFDWGPGNLLKN